MTTQIKALDEYFLMVVFTLVLNRLLVFAIVMFNLDRETALKGLKTKEHNNNNNNNLYFRNPTGLKISGPLISRVKKLLA